MNGCKLDLEIVFLLLLSAIELHPNDAHYQQCFDYIMTLNLSLEFIKTKVWTKEEKHIIFTTMGRINCAKKIANAYKKYKIQKRMNMIKKELVERTWHPKRFMTWCLDCEEYKDIMS